MATAAAVEAGNEKGGKGKARTTRENSKGKPKAKAVKKG